MSLPNSKQKERLYESLVDFLQDSGFIVQATPYSEREPMIFINTPVEITGQVNNHGYMGVTTYMPAADTRHNHSICFRPTIKTPLNDNGYDIRQDLTLHLNNDIPCNPDASKELETGLGCMTFYGDNSDIVSIKTDIKNSIKLGKSFFADRYVGQYGVDFNSSELASDSLNAMYKIEKAAAEFCRHLGKNPGNLDLDSKMTVLISNSKNKPLLYWNKNTLNAYAR